MSKKILFAFIFLMTCIAIATFWITTPNQEQKIHHQALFCSTLQREKNNLNADELFSAFQFLFNNSTPTYAYNKPKFYNKYAQTLIQNYLALPIEQQHIAQKDYEQCRHIITF